LVNFWDKLDAERYSSDSRQSKDRRNERAAKRELSAAIHNIAESVAEIYASRITEVGVGGEPPIMPEDLPDA
jgi:hypothetical protein